MKTARLMLIALALFAAAACLKGQTCVYNFSESINVYPSSDGSTMYASVSVVDDSGCNHSNYTTNVSLTSPSGRSANAGLPGLYSDTALGFDSETGAWAVQTTGTFWCPVAGSWAGFGNGWGILIANTRTFYMYPIPETSGCEYTATACASGTPTCSGGRFFLPGPAIGCPRYLAVSYPRITIASIVECYSVNVLAAGGPGNCT